jgi:hypothetical protein
MLGDNYVTTEVSGPFTISSGWFAGQGWERNENGS